MALMDMIMESMIDQPDQSFMEMHQREEAAEDKMAMESLGGFGDLPSADEDITMAPETVPAVESECRVMSAESFLSAMESHMEIRGSLEPATESCIADDLHKALEEGLPTDKAPYDPNAELDDIAETLAGIDADNDMDPDQPQPDENIENDMTIGNLVNEPQDKAPEMASEGFMAAVKNFFKPDENPESRKNREARLRELTPEQLCAVYAKSLRLSKIKIYKFTDDSSKFAHDSAALTIAAAKKQGLDCKVIPAGNGEILYIDGGKDSSNTTINAWCNIPHMGGDNLISDHYDGLIKSLAKDKDVKI